MDADSTEESPLPPMQILLSTSFPGSNSSVPIRAPLTIDSDSEYSLSINDQIHSRTSSFDSSFSIDISSALEEDDTFVAYADEEIVIESSHVEECSFTRSFVKYPDGNYSKDGSNIDNSAIFRPFVKYPDGNYYKDGSNVDNSAIFRPFVKYPDGNYVKGGSDFDESSIFRPSVKIESCEETGSDLGIKVGVPVAHLTSDCDSDLYSVDGSLQKVGLVPTIRVYDEEPQFEGVPFVDHIEDIDESNDVINGTDLVETIEVAGQKVECLNQVVDMCFGDDISDSDESRNLINSTHLGESIETSGQKAEYLNEVVGMCFGDEINNIDKSDGVIDTDLAESIEDAGQNVEYSNENMCSVSVQLIEVEKVERLNEVMKLSESDESSFDLKSIDPQIVLDSDKEMEIKSIKTQSENEEEMVMKLQPIRAKFLRLVRLLGLSNEDSVVRQLLNRLTLGKHPTVNVNGGDSNDEFDFSLTILVIGKTGVGKSATINSIFGEQRSSTDAFRPITTTVQEITGNVNGVRLKFLDTPGLKGPSERSYNRKIISSIKRFTRKQNPDVVLYVDRLDTYTCDFSDTQLIRSIKGSLGSSVWRNCIIVLTHASSFEPSSGFVSRRCRFLQEQIVSFGGTVRHTVNPVWLVENHPSYKEEKDWRSRVLVLCYSAKILHEANSMVKRSVGSLEHSGLFEFGDRLGHDIDLDRENEVDRVPSFEQAMEPWNAANRSVVERRKVCFEEYGYRVKVLGKIHWSVGCRFYC